MTVTNNINVIIPIFAHDIMENKFPLAKLFPFFFILKRVYKIKNTRFTGQSGSYMPNRVAASSKSCGCSLAAGATAMIFSSVKGGEKENALIL